MTRRPANSCLGISLGITAVGIVIIAVIVGVIGMRVWQRDVGASLQRPEVDDHTVLIAAIAPLARESMAQTKVPASVIMGQAILESGWGTSALSNWSGNYFGIKCGDRVSPRQSGCVSKETQEYYEPDEPVTEVAKFRNYRSARDSFLDHGELLRDTPRYRKAFDYTDDPDKFITEVRKSGYATDPKYSQMIIKLMRDYDLYRYDEGAPAGVPVQGAYAKTYRDLGGVDGDLGVPLGPPQEGPIADTSMMIFNNGVIINVDGKTYGLNGPLWQRYREDAKVREKLGRPLSVRRDRAEFEGGVLRTRGGDRVAEVQYSS